MYLLSCDYSIEEVKRLIAVDLRGELTPPKASKFSLAERGFIRAVSKALTFHTDEGSLKDISDALLPVVMCNVGALGDVKEMERLIKVDGIDPNTKDYDNRSAILLASSNGNSEMVEYLLSIGANPNCTDRWNHTPYTEAVQFNHQNVIKVLEEYENKNSSS
jgi:hypothetical protein